MAKIERPQAHVITPDAGPPTTAKTGDGTRTRGPGRGRVFKRPQSRYWWIAYCRQGKEIRESAETTDEKVARQLLKDKLFDVDADRKGVQEWVGPAQKRVTVAEILDDLETHYEIRERRSLVKFRSHLKAVKAAFGNDKALAVTTSRLDGVVKAWREEGFANATINRRLAVLRRAFTLARKATPPKLSRVPAFEMLEEENAREGFFEKAELFAVLPHLPDDDLRDFVTWAFWTGMRKGEIAGLTWAAFDRETGILRLHARAANAKKSRPLVLDGPLRDLIDRRVKARRLDCPLIFHRGGQPFREFRKSWATACIKAGFFRMVGMDAKGQPIRVPTKLFHDLRRTGVRNLIRAGVPQSVAMAISGHRTASVFRRYDITSEQDLRNAVAKVTAYIESLPSTSTVIPLARGVKGSGGSA